MMDNDILKGNFSVKKPVDLNKIEAEKGAGKTLREEVKSKVLASLGGSMAYVEREILHWDGDQ